MDECIQQEAEENNQLDGWQDDALLGLLGRCNRHQCSKDCGVEELDECTNYAVENDEAIDVLDVVTDELRQLCPESLSIVGDRCN